jgi:hypothetical protein
LGFLGLGLATAALVLASEALVRRLRPERDEDDPVLLLLVFTLLQSATMLTAGFAGLLRPLPLGLAGAVALAGLLAAGVRPDWPRWRPRPGAGRAARIARLLLGLGTGILLVKTLAWSPYWLDALYYHLPKVAAWIQEGRFAMPVGHDPRQWFSAGFELVELWWVVFPRHDLLIELGGFQMFLLALASVRRLASAHGWNPDLAALGLAFVPGVILHATACGNDLAVAALVLSALALVASGAPRLLQALPLVLGAGVKASAIFAGAGVFCLAALRPRPRGTAPRGPAATLLGLAVAVASSWYLRNTILHGHPLFPAAGRNAPMTFLGTGPGDAADTVRFTVANLVTGMTDPRPFTAFADGSTSWGWFVLPAGLPCAILLLRSDPAFRRLALAFAAGWIPVIALSPANTINLRFALWFPAIFVLAAAARPGRWTWSAATVAALLNGWATLAPVERTPPPDHVRPDLPEGEPVACLMVYDSPAYRLYGPDFSRRVIYPASFEELEASDVQYAEIWPGAPGAELVRARWISLGGPLYRAPPRR